jgi:ketosteroid isomerase-like protein
MNPNVAFMQGMYAAFNRCDMPGDDPLRRRGDTVAPFGKFTATSKSAGRTFSVPMAHLVRIRDGKIYHHQAFTDTHAVAGAHRA